MHRSGLARPGRSGRLNCKEIRAITIHLPGELEREVQAEVLSGHFSSADDVVAAAVRDYFRQRRQEHAQQDAAYASSGGVATPTKRKPLWERAAELRKSIPAEEWAKLPRDGAEQLDHYIHGSPKRPSS
jgi:Arc/MetJ-type ribon-helix-helix transcriptional regulator